MRHILLVLCFAVTVIPAFAQTYAERLGYSKGARLLIINSDDAGMSHATNLAIFESLEKGITSSISIMAPTPWVPEVLDYYRKNPKVDVGAHLTLCSEWDFYRFMPVAGAGRVPSLADEMGCLHDNNKLFMEHAKPEEVETELRAQIERLEKAGFKLSHIDSHMWSLFQKPAFTEVYVKLAIEKQLAIRLVGDTSPEGFVATAEPDTIEKCRPYVQRVWDAGLPVLDDMHTESYSWKTEDKTALYADAIRRLRPGITEFVVHPTKPDDTIDFITKHRILLYGDYYALTDPAILEVIKVEGVQLVSWGELLERRKAIKQER